MGQDGGGDQSSASYDSNVDDFTAGDHFEIRKYDVSSRVALERENNPRYKYRCTLSTTGTT